MTPKVLDGAGNLLYDLTMPQTPSAAFQKAFMKRCPMASSVMLLFDYLPHVYFYAKDDRGRFVKVNRMFLDNHGLSNEAEAIGRTDRDFHPPAMAQAYMAEDRRVMAGRKPIPAQVWLVLHHRRTPRWYVSSKIPLFDPRGKVVGIAGAMYLIEEPAEQARHFQELAPVIAFIEANHGQAISMASMAKLAGLSPSHFNRRFQTLLRMTPTQYLLSVRIQAAQRLLVTTRSQIIDVAHRTGFTDQSHLTHRFKRLTGMTPAAYRRQFRK